jgi:hypothetical protein
MQASLSGEFQRSYVRSLPGTRYYEYRVRVPAVIVCNKGLRLLVKSGERFAVAICRHGIAGVRSLSRVFRVVVMASACVSFSNWT